MSLAEAVEDPPGLLAHSTLSVHPGSEEFFLTREDLIPPETTAN